MAKEKKLKLINKITSKIGLDFYYWLYCRQFKRNFDRQYGFFSSLKAGAPFFSEKNPLPWFTFPAIVFLKKIDFSNKSILEYGGGSSSKYFSERCSQLVTIENDSEWFRHLETLNIKNQKLIYEPDLSLYPSSPKDISTDFDVVIVDGRERVRCIDFVLSLPRKPVIIILDNSERYPAAISNLVSKGYFEVPFEGMSSGNPHITCTSFFFNSIQNNAYLDMIK